MRSALVLFMTTILVAACSSDSTPTVGQPSSSQPSRAPAVVPSDTSYMGSFDIRLEPLSGRATVTPVDGTLAPATAKLFDYSGGGVTVGACAPAGNCLPPSNTVALSTAQSQVLYHDSANVCHSNGAIVACPTTGACSQPKHFCAPITLISNVPRALPGLVIQIGQAADANSIAGCVDPVGNSGMCATSTGRTDSSQSTLISPIPGDGTTTFGCSYCYGNQSRANSAGLPGLVDAVVPGLNATLVNINTDTVEFVLNNDSNMNVTASVFAGKPGFGNSGTQLALSGAGGTTCASQGSSTVTISGRNFGPPAPCLGSLPLSSCPTSGSPASGYSVNLNGTSMTVSSWSDSTIVASIPASASSGTVQVVTPTGTTSTTDIVAICTANLTVTAAAGTPTTLSPGRQVVVAGTGFVANENVTVLSNGATWFTTAANSSGAFSVTNNVPQMLQNGTWEVAALGQGQGDYVAINSSVTVDFTATTSGVVGSTLTIGGSVFVSGETVSFAVDGTTVGTASANGSGVASLTTTLPAGSTASAVVTASAPSGVSYTRVVSRSPSVALAAATGVSGYTTDVSGSGFGASETVTLSYDGSSLGTATTGSNGSFSASVTFPSGSSGSHTVRAIGATSQRTATTTATISAGTLTATTSTTASGTTATLTGTGFVASTGFTVTADGTTIGSGIADASGNVSGTFTLPVSSRMGSLIRVTQGSLAAREVDVTRTPSVNLSSTAGTPGTSVTVSVAGFSASSSIDITIDDDTWGTVTTGTNGSGSATLVVPASITGTRVVRATGPNGRTAVTGTSGSGGSFAVTSDVLLTPGNGAPGTSVVVSGGGYIPGETLTIMSEGAVLASPVVAANGTFSATVSHVISTGNASALVQVLRGSTVLAQAFFNGNGNGQNAVGTVTITPASGGQRRIVSMSSATAFTTGETVTAFVGGMPFASAVKGTGTISFSAQLPGMPAGTYTLTLYGNTSTRFAQSPVTVSASTLSSTSGASSTTQTATGSGLSPSQTATLSVVGAMVGSGTTTGGGGLTTTYTMPSGQAYPLALRSTTTDSGTATGTVNRTMAITLSSTSGAPGTSRSITASGFAASETVNVTFDGSTWTTGTSSTTGLLTVTASTPSRAPGTYTVIARGATSGEFVSTTYTVTGSITASSPVAVGGTISLSGSGFNTAQAVTVKLGTTTIGSGNVDGSGNLTATATMPAGAAQNLALVVSGNTTGFSMLVPTTRSSSASFLPASPGLGSALLLTASAFSPSEMITVSIDDATLTTVGASASGGLAGALVSPPPLRSAVHTIMLRGVTSGTVVTMGYAPASSVTFTPSFGQAGGSITAQGTGFSPGATATLTVAGTTLASSTVGGGGTFTVSFTIPTGPLLTLGVVTTDPTGTSVIQTLVRN